jgi:glutamate synthase (NADPH/NADH) small chain
MSNGKRFFEYNRQSGPGSASAGRTESRFEMDIPLISQEALVSYVNRCLDCGIPFCHAIACPLHNPIPDVCVSLRKNRWQKACDLLHSTNNFPEITGRICPAPCESTCAQRTGGEGVPIRQMEYQIAEYGFANDWIKPALIDTSSGKRVVVVGSGPAGLAAAQQLVRSGHEVIVFEKDEHIGGFLRYGVPDFKLSRTVLDRRLDQLKEEGVRFVTGITVGEDISYSYLCKMCDAICVAVETGPPRDLPLPGRNLRNVIFGTEYLRQINMLNAGEKVDPQRIVSVRDKVVAVIGGGNTGCDCVDVARREGAERTYQLEIKPEEQILPHKADDTQTDESCEDDSIRRWCIYIKSLSGFEGKVNELHGIEVEWLDGQDGHQMREIPGTEFSLAVDIVLLAIGFEHVSRDSIFKKLGLKLGPDESLTADGQDLTDQVGLFATVDAMTEAPLVGRAISSGRAVAAQIDRYLVAH